ncbi:hypothetical protein [Streptomyces synnematoformans]|uniref:VCBS repeat-containing protein n=1 Tax=Streptomyces synnematoformans TaxID=415721 RepID=A0ABN2YUB4_9ACTN
MIRRATPSALVLSPLLVLAAACGGGAGDGTPSPAADGASRSGVPATRAPAPGEGSQDPDDLNGDGHRDLLVPVFLGADPETAAECVGVVYGSADGLDPAVHTVHRRAGLGLPDAPADLPGPARLSVDHVVTADLDDDGFPDFVATARGPGQAEGTGRERLHVSFGGPRRPVADPVTTAVHLPAGGQGVDSVVRGDFDGDGHHDLAAQQPGATGGRLAVLYGPFTRAGEPARVDTGLPYAEGTLVADRIDPSGEPRATSLLRRGEADGGQATNTLYPARPGEGLSGEVRELQLGSAHAFGDFDGDGSRDVAVGDDGGRNNEPGYGTEKPEVAGKATVYPGDGGGPAVLDLPGPPPGEGGSPYGPGGFAAADPDGDGRDGLLVSTYEDATLIDGVLLGGDERVSVLREGPARTADGRRTAAKDRNARPAGAADFDGDGGDELILNWAPDPLFALYGEKPTYWWITDGASSRDATAFTTTEFAPGP